MERIDQQAASKALSSVSQPNSPERRSLLMRKLIVQSELAMGRTPSEGSALQVIEKSWEFALSGIPTHHLEECFKRALAAKRDTFPFCAAEVNKAWDDLKQELLRKGPENEPLMLPAGKFDEMTESQWKARHNLSGDWKRGDSYPETSDLYNKPKPLTYDERRLFTCYNCKDAGWVRIPYNTVTAKVELIRCDCKTTDPA